MVRRSRFGARENKPELTPALTRGLVSTKFRAPAMAKSDITGKRKLKAQNVSHSNIKTKRWQNINVQTRRIWVPEYGRFVTLKLTTRDIRTIDKIGILAYAKRHGVKL
jgi:large subunit ribosomal protein L28